MDNRADKNNPGSVALRCYRRGGVWLCDDSRRGILSEPLFTGSQWMIEFLLRRTGIWPGAHHGFELTISTAPLEASHQLTLAETADNGAVYTFACEAISVRGVLNPLVIPSSPGVVPATLWLRLSRPVDSGSATLDLRSGRVTCGETVPPLNAALATLRAALPEERLAWLRSASDQEIVDAHLGLGSRVRSVLGLWQESPLMTWLAEQGIPHPDDASEELLRALRAQLHHEGGCG